MMDANVITIETSHSDMELLRGFGDSVRGRCGLLFRGTPRVDSRSRIA
jgi:hypothetical protein